MPRDGFLTTRVAASIAAGAAALLAGALFLGWIVLPAVYDAAWLEKRIGERLGPGYEVRVAEVRLGFFASSVRITDIDLRPHGPPNDSVQSGSVPVRGRLRIPEVSLQGLDYGHLLVQWRIRYRTGFVREPSLDLLLPPADRGPSSARREQEPRRGPPNEIAARTEAASTSRIGELRVEDGDLTVRRRGRPFILSSWEDLTITAREVGIDPGSSSPLDRLVCHALSFRVEQFERISEKGFYRLGAEDIDGSTATGALRVGRLRFDPRFAPAVFMDRLDERDAMYRTTLHSVHVEGLAYDRLLGGHLIARYVGVDSSQTEILLDRRVPDTPEPPPVLPHRWAQRTGRIVRVDSARVEHARVRYAIHPETRDGAGHLDFADVSVELSGLVVDSARSAPARPVAAVATGRLAGTGPFRLTMHVPLYSADFSFRYRLAVGRFELHRLDSILIPASGLSFTDGTVDTLTAEAVVGSGTAEGHVEAVYRDLQVRFVEDSGVRSRLIGPLKNLLFNRFVVASSSGSAPGGPGRTGEIHHAYEPGTPFPKFVWRSLRTGLIDVVMD